MSNRRSKIVTVQSHNRNDTINFGQLESLLKNSELEMISATFQSL